MYATNIVCSSRFISRIPRKHGGNEKYILGILNLEKEPVFFFFEKQKWGPLWLYYNSGRESVLGLA